MFVPGGIAASMYGAIVPAAICWTLVISGVAMYINGRLSALGSREMIEAFAIVDLRTSEVLFASTSREAAVEAGERVRGQLENPSVIKGATFMIDVDEASLRALGYAKR